VQAGEARDEVGELRAALERGEWPRLTDPLLPLLLLDNPAADWWAQARARCLELVGDSLPNRMSRAENDSWGDRWLRALWPEDEDRRAPAHPEPMAVELGWCLAKLAASGRGYERQRAALAVLEQFAPP
jgi:hypothetical protein